MNGELPPDSRHSIYSLADALEVSRTPVREAVLRLADLDLVTIEKNRGVVVRSVSADEIAALFQMRFIIEDVAVRAAARARSDGIHEQLIAFSQQMTEAFDAADERAFLQADRAWHRAIVEVLGNSWVHRQLMQLRYATPPSADHSTPRLQRLESILTEHRAIQAAVHCGSTQAASDAMRAHLIATARSLVDPQELDLKPASWPMNTWGTLASADMPDGPTANR